MTDDVKKRFLKAMRHCISEMYNGVRNKKMFALEMEMTPQQIHNLESDPNRIPTVLQVCMICKKFAVNPSYIILGFGSIMMVETGSIESRISRLEKKVSVTT